MRLPNLLDNRSRSTLLYPPLTSKPKRKVGFPSRMFFSISILISRRRVSVRCLLLKPALYYEVTSSIVFYIRFNSVFSRIFCKFPVTAIGRVTFICGKLTLCFFIFREHYINDKRASMCRG